MTLTTQSIADVVDELLAEISPSDAALYRRRFNVAPSDLHWVVGRGDSGRRVLLPAVWGFLAGPRALINVRGEALASGTTFRDAFRTSRCVVVSDGFLEWNAAKSPFWYHRADGGLLLLAGICQPARGSAVSAAPDGAPRPTDAVSRPRFAVITTRPNQVVSQVHNRMPVVLERDRVDDWLTGAPTAATTALLAPAAEDRLLATPLSRRINSVKHDDEECLAPQIVVDHDAADDPFSPRQKTLF